MKETSLLHELTNGVKNVKVFKKSLKHCIYHCFLLKLYFFRKLIYRMPDRMPKTINYSNNGKT